MIPAFLLKFLSPKVILALIVAAVIGFFVWERGHMKSTIQDLELEVQNYESAEEAQKIADDLIVDANEKRVIRIKEIEYVDRVVEKIVRETLDAPETEDGPVAPVLRDAITAIDSLRRQTGSDQE